jgi:sugar lactone lactonase YvrE
MKKRRTLRQVAAATVLALLLLAGRAWGQNLFATTAGSTITEIGPDQVETTFASGLNSAFAVTFDNEGNLFVSDNGSGRIYEYTNNGTLSSNATVFASGLNAPTGIAFNSAGNLFVGDGSGDITEIITNGTPKIFASGSSSLYGLAFNSAGNLFATAVNGDIYEFTNRNGILNSNGIVFATVSYQPTGLAFDTKGDLFVANDYLCEFTNNNGTLSSNATVFAPGLGEAFGLALDNAGNLYAAGNGESANIYIFGPHGTRDVFAPGGFFGLAFQPGSEPQTGYAGPDLFVSCNANNSAIYEIISNGWQIPFASLSGPNATGVAFNSAGNLFIANLNDTITEVTSGGAQSTFASGLNSPQGLAFNSAGNLFVANEEANNIIEITPSGAESVYASGILNPLSLAFDRADNLFVGSGSSIIEIPTTGTPETFISGSGISDYPSGLAFDGVGNLYEANITEIVEFTTNNSQITFATDSDGYLGLAIDARGNLIAVAGDQIVEIMPDGTQKAISEYLPIPNGLAIQPVPFLQAATANGAFQLTITMPSPCYTTIVQASSDLMNWTDICTDTPPFTFTDSLASSRFYRALLDTNFY